MHPFLAVAREEDGKEHAQEVVQLDEAIKEHDDREHPDQHPAGHHRTDRPLAIRGKAPRSGKQRDDLPPPDDQLLRKVTAAATVANAAISLAAAYRFVRGG